MTVDKETSRQLNMVHELSSGLEHWVRWYRLHRATVWAALNDPEVLKAAIPGCQELEKLSDTEFQATVPEWLTSGQLIVRETVREGLDDAVPAFLDLLRGGNTGKMVVRLAPDPG